MQTWKETIESATHTLGSGNIRDASLNAELLAAHVLGVWTRSEVRARETRTPTSAEQDTYRALVQRRLSHEPLQYITGETEFFGLRLFTTPATLIPRPDTEILVEEAIKAAGQDPVRVLDIGTGTGCIALALASKLPQATILGIDNSSEAIALAQRNKDRYPWSNISFEHADIFSEQELAKIGTFDMIVSNPPYIPLEEYQTLDQEVRQYEPKQALTDGGTGLTFYKRIFEVAPRLLHGGHGTVLVEIGFGAAADVISLAETLGPVTTIKDLSGIDRVLEISV